MARTIQTSGPEQTAAVGADLAGFLVPGDVIVLSGDLGTGKTTLVRGACRALGVTGPVTSPTFTIGNRYSARSGLVVSHLDLYRLTSLSDEDPELLADYLGPDRIAFVEWPEAAADELGPVRIGVSLRHGGGDLREIEVQDR